MYHNDFNDAVAAGLAIGIIILIAFVFLAIKIGIKIFYILTLQKALKQVSPELRKIPTGNVWLLLIPVFDLIYQFIVVGAIADSLKAEFAKRNIPVQEERPGYNIGLAYCILFVCFFIPFASLAGIVCWIIYWVKISEYKSKLEIMTPPAI